VRKLKVALGIVVSLACLGLAVAGIEWSRVGGALRRADWRYLLPAGAALLGFLVARSARWTVLLGGRAGLGRAFSLTNVGYLISNILPLRLGDPARAVAMGLDDDVKVSTALSTVVVERVLDMLTVVALLAVTAPFVTDAGWTREAGIVGAGIGLAAIGLMTALALKPEWARRLLTAVLDRVAWLESERWLAWFDGLVEGLAALRSPRGVVALIGWSMVAWGMTVGHYLGLLHAFVPQPSLVEASFLTCATALGVALPSSPGAVGVFHSVARYALELPFGFKAETAVVIAFAAHTFQYVVMCGLGAVGLLRENLSLAQLRTGAAVATQRSD
jgi:hypothetical protein